jgi:hypothetical protein
MPNLAKPIFIHLDRPEDVLRQWQRLGQGDRSRLRGEIERFQTENPEAIGLKPLPPARVAALPLLNLSAKRFAPVLCGPMEITISELEEEKHITIRVMSLVSSNDNENDDEPPRGGTSARGAKQPSGSVIHIAATLFIRRSITSDVTVEFAEITMTSGTNRFLAEISFALSAAISCVMAAELGKGRLEWNLTGREADRVDTVTVALMEHLVAALATGGIGIFANNMDDPLVGPDCHDDGVLSMHGAALAAGSGIAATRASAIEANPWSARLRRFDCASNCFDDSNVAAWQLASDLALAIDRDPLPTRVGHVSKGPIWMM